MRQRSRPTVPDNPAVFEDLLKLLPNGVSPNSMGVAGCRAFRDEAGFLRWSANCA
jgi:hypothetical protein